MRGVHVLGLVAILMGSIALRATEYYTARYQTLPVLDWLDSRPPLVESSSVPAAADLARGLARALPLLIIRDDIRPRSPVFGPPAIVQRAVGGVRDAASIELGSPGTFQPDKVPVRARLDVIVFHRALRAASWLELMVHAMDIRDPQSGLLQTPMTGTDEVDRLWLVAPSEGGGIATMAGHRGCVGFVLQVTFLRQQANDPAELADLSARAELLARQASADWSAWVEQNYVAAG